MALSSKDNEIAELRKKNEQLEAKIVQLAGAVKRIIRTGEMKPVKLMKCITP